MRSKVSLIPAVLLLTVVAKAEVAPATPEQIAEGRKNYMTTCVACHQPNGAGLPAVFPSIVKSEYVNGSPARLVAMVLKGISPPFNYNGVLYTQMMIPQEAVLTDDKIASILTFVRASFENSAPPVTAEFVAEVRKKLADRKTPLTEAEIKAWKDEAVAP